MGAVLNRPLAVTTAAALFTLTGCGVVTTEFHPGAAAEVGSQIVTVSHVDEVAADYCTAVEDQITQSGNKLPMRILRSGVAGQLALVSAAEQLAEEYGVEPTDQYRTELSTIESQASDLEPDVAESFVEVNSASAYVGDVLTSVGAIELGGDGAEPTIEERQTAGLEVLSSWMDREGVVVDPRYGIEFRDGQPVGVDTDVSYAFGDVAKAGLLPEPDAAYAATLSDELVCG